MKREDILKVYEAGPGAVINLVNTLSEQITALQERVKALPAFTRLCVPARRQGRSTQQK